MPRWRRRTPGSRPPRPRDRARARRRSRPSRPLRWRDRGRGACWSLRWVGRGCRSARGTGSFGPPPASADRARGRASRSTAPGRGRRHRSRLCRSTRRSGAAVSRPSATRSGMRQVEDVALRVIEAAIPVPRRLDHLGCPGDARAVRTRRSPGRGRRPERRTTRTRAARHPGSRAGRAPRMGRSERS